MALRKLPNNIQSLFCASLQINSYKKAIEELVYNSLDADSTSIAIRVNIAENSIQVIDNGSGLSKSDFSLLGERHATSKCVDQSSLKSAPNKYGFRGLSLASIIEVSRTVTITSRFQNTEETWIKSFYKGKEPKLCETSQRPSKGSTVVIKGFLHNLNIQRKAIEALNELNNVKFFLEQLSLVHHNISLSLRDDSKNEIIFELHKNRDIYQRLESMFGINKKDIQELKVEKNEYKVTSYISKLDKEFQQKHWIYLNGKLLQDSKVHKVVNDKLGKALKFNCNNNKIKSKHDNNKEENYLQNNKIPTYFIFLNCPYYDYDVNFTGKRTMVEFKNWDHINKLLEKLAKFYAGDINLKEIKPVINQVSNVKKVEDTRDQVKKIMEKILESHPKKLGIVQMQKGIKGKLIKRKNKLKRQKISQSNLILFQNTKIIDALPKPAEDSHEIIEIDTIRCDTSTTKAKLKEHYKRKEKANKITTNKNKKQSNPKVKSNIKDKKENEDCNKYNSIEFVKKANDDKQTENNINLDVRPKKRKIIHHINRKSYMPSISTKKTYKQKKYVKDATKQHKNKHDDVLKKFNDDPTGSIKRRCNMLEHKVDGLMSYKKKRKRKIFINETVQYSNVIRNNKNYSIRKKVGEIVIHDYVPLPPKFSPCTFDDRVWDKVKKKAHKSSYDLVKTILKTQETIEERKQITSSEVMHLSTISKLTNNVGPIHSYTEIDETPQIPLSSYRMTFDSHNYGRERVGHNKYDIENLHKKSNYMQFISTNSRENFKIPERQIQRKSYKSGHEKKTNHNKLFKNLCDMKESSYSIEFSKTNGIQQKHEDNPETNILLDLDVDQNNDKTYTIDHNDNNQSFRFGSTYTVSINDTTNNMNTQNHTDHGLFENVHEIYNIEETVGNHSSQYFRNNILTENVHNNTNRNRDGDNRNIIFISKSQEQNSMTDTSTVERHINPLDVCEIIQSNDIFDENVSIRKINDSLFNGDFDVESFLCNKDAYSEKSQAIVEDIDFSLSGDEILNEKNMRTVITKVPNDLNCTSSNRQIDSQVLDQYNNEEFCNRKENQVNDDNNFDFKTRLRFVPKGMSQIFQNCERKNVCDYNIDNDCYEEDIYNNFAKEIELHSKIFEPNIQNVKEVTTKAIDKVNDKLNKDNASLIFCGESLKQAKVLGQIDKKFIAAKISGSSHQSLEPSEYLVLFDQHAVHERIRLENNLKDYIKENRWKGVALDGICINVPKAVIMYLHNYEEKFAQLGLQWTILNDNKVSINAIPEALLGKNPRQVDIVIKAVKNLITEEIDCIKNQRGCISLYPKAIMDLVFSEVDIVFKADKNDHMIKKYCRVLFVDSSREYLRVFIMYAIKFGDKLSTKESEELLNALSECKTPFQCAHGRPVMAVIMNIKSTKRVYKVNLANGYKWRKVQKK